MSPRYATIYTPDTSFPRVSGDEPEVPSADQPHYVFSPRERG